MLGSDRYRKARTVVAVMAGMILGANMMAPAVAHVTGSLKHLHKHLDKRYVRSTGQIAVPVFHGWTSGSAPGVEVIYRGQTTTFDSNGGSLNTVNMTMVPPIPSTMNGNRLTVTGVEICYQVNDPVYIDNVHLAVYSSTGPGSAGGNAVHDSLDDRTQPECRSFTGSPRTLSRNGFIVLNVGVKFPFGPPSSMYIQRTTFFLRPAK